MQDHHSHPVTSIVCSVLSWASLIVTLQDIDTYFRILASLVAVVTGVYACVNWHWSIKKNKKIAKKDIPF